MAGTTDIQPPVQSGPVLAAADRDRLAGIVQKMKDNGESDENIQTAVSGFKQKYSVNPTKAISGPTPQQTKSVLRTIQQPAQPTPQISNNPNKVFPDYEKALTDYKDVLDRQSQVGRPLGTEEGTDPKALQQQADLLKTNLTKQEVAAKGTLDDLVQNNFLKNSKNYLTADGIIDYRKLSKDTRELAQQNGGGNMVGETLFHLASNALQLQQDKPGVDAEFEKENGMKPEDFMKGSKSAQALAELKSSMQSNYTGEVQRSQDVITKKSNDLFQSKYQPVLEYTAQRFGQNSPEFQMAVQGAQKNFAIDLRDIQTGENARLLRIRGEQSRIMDSKFGDIQDQNQGEINNFNTRYNQAYQNYLANEQKGKAITAEGMGTALSSAWQSFGKTLWSGLNSYMATRGSGLVAAGFNNPITDFLQGRQTEAERSDVPDNPLQGSNLLNPTTYLTRVGRGIGQSLPDIALTALTKNPTFAGLEMTASSTLSGMGDVLNQAMKDGYSVAEAHEKAGDFAQKNFFSTLPANMVMGSAILANLKGAGGFLANTGKELAGGLGASLIQQYQTQAQGKESKTATQFLQDDAPKSALENVIALAGMAPIMRAVGHLTSSMSENKMNGVDRQFYSDLIDKQGVGAAHATAELQYLNGALDDNSLAQTKQLIDQIAQTKGSLTGLDVHPDHQKLFLQTQKDIQDLQAQRTAATDETVQKVLDQRIKEKQGEAQETLSGKTPYVKFTTPLGHEFVAPMDRVESILNDPALQRDLAAGHLRAQAFGDEKDTAPVTQRLNEINQSATNTHTAELSVGDNPPPLEAPSGPNITEVRHGETDEDQSGHVSGTDGIPLNKVGQQEAEKLADDAQNRNFTKVVGSDVPRNIETAKAVADKLGVPHETIPGLNSWDVGEWNGASEEDYNRAEHYFVEHPDENTFEGKRVNETFNQYKDRIIKTRQDLEDNNQGNTLLVNHSGNMNVWDAYKESGNKWDEAAKAHYLNAPDAEPGVLPPTPEEEKVAKEAEGTKSDGEITKNIQEQLQQTNPNFIGRSPELAGFYDKFKDEIGSVKDSSLDYRVNIPDMTQSQREGAVKDIDQGKTSGRATKLLDALQKMHEEGMIDYTRGRGNHVEKMGIAIEHFDRAQEALASEAEGWKKAPQHLIDAFEAELKNIDNETDKEPAGPLHDSGEPETADRSDDAASGRSQTDAADQKRLSADDQAKGGRVNPKGDAGEPEPARLSSRDEFERELKAALASDKLTEGVAVGSKPHTLEQYLDKAKAVLGQLFPDHSIRAYETEKEYMEKEGRPAGSAGVFDPKGKYLAFNLERIRKMGAENTIFHEVIHPIVHEAMESRPGAVDAAYSRLVDMKDTPGMENVWAHEDLYRDRGLNTMKVEAITEFLTHVADGRIDASKFKPDLRTRFIDMVNKVFKALGINKQFSTAQDIGRLADSVKQAFTEADARPVEEALGRTPEDTGGEKMDALKNSDEDRLRAIVTRYGDQLNPKELSDSIQRATGMDEKKADAMIEGIHKEQATKEKSVEEVKKEYFGKENDWMGRKDLNRVNAQIEARKFQDDIKASMKGDPTQVGISPSAVDKAIHIYLDTQRNPAHFDEYYNKLSASQQKIADLSQHLNPVQKEIAERINQQYEQLGKQAKDEGLIKDALDHYVNRAWDMGDKPATEQNFKFKTSSKHQLQRTLDTILQGQAQGMSLKVEGASNNLAVLKEEIGNVLENKRHLQDGLSLKIDTGRTDDNGKPIKGTLFTTNPEEGYQKIENPFFRKWEYAGKLEDYSADDKQSLGRRKDILITENGTVMKKSDVYAPKDVAQSLNNILGSSKLPLQGLMRFGAAVKQAILSFSGFHFIAFSRAHFLGSKFITPRDVSPITAFKTGLKMLAEQHPIGQELIKNGMTINRSQDFNEMATTRGNWLADQADKFGFTKKAKDTLLNLSEGFHHYLFQTYGAGLKMFDGINMAKAKMAQNPSADPKSIYANVAKLMNDTYGGINWNRMQGSVMQNPTFRQLSSMLLLAPDWTASNLRFMKNAIGTGDQARLYQKAWARVIIRGAVLTTAANAIMACWDDKDDDGNQLTWLQAMERRAKIAWNNGGLRSTMIDMTPLYHGLGGDPNKRAYFSIFGAYTDPISMIANPGEFIEHKGSFIAKAGLEAMTGQNWQGRQFTSLDELLGMDDKGVYDKTVEGHQKGDLNPNTDLPYKRTVIGHDEGDKKGGKLAGQLTKWPQGGAHPIGWMQLPSYLGSEFRGMFPTALQNSWQIADGENDMTTGILNAIGTGIHVNKEKPPEKKPDE